LPELPDVEVYLEYSPNGEVTPSANDSKKVAELLKEITLLKEEHAQNIKDYLSKIDQQEVHLLLKSTQCKDVNQLLVAKEREISKHKEEVEKAVRSLKD
jgi:rubrerythrin